MTALLVAVFVASLLGSLHCAGMCGGIVTFCVAGRPLRPQREWTPQVLYTLATAYWANGNRAEALALEEDALARAGAHREFYRGQMEKFRTTEYSPSSRFPDAGQTTVTP